MSMSDYNYMIATYCSIPRYIIVNHARYNTGEKDRVLGSMWFSQKLSYAHYHMKCQC